MEKHLESGPEQASSQNIDAQNPNAVAEGLKVAEKSIEAIEKLVENTEKKGDGGKADRTTKQVVNQVRHTLRSDDKKQNVTLPPVDVQRKEVVKSLQKEQKSLEKKMNQMQKKKHLDASRMEKIIEKMRKIQRVIDQIMQLAQSTLRVLYQRYVQK